ncbi:MAG: (2Fe-2S)-binding protein [Bacteroidales bacterium]|nr:(2Fe-2S)-binding protein [Bacteroidales bacterium]
MVSIKINGKTVEVEQGTTVLKAAEKAGFTVPAMCHNDDVEQFTSCMICIVKEISQNRLIPSCSVEVTDGMNVVTEDGEIAEARKMALELLLSDHVGDCEAPCRLACPAHMNIPLMNRLLAEGKTDEALKVVRNDIVLPSVLGRICPAPCENACRRKTINDAVSICLLKRFAGDEGQITASQPSLPLNGKRVAVIGCGPAGLSAAYYLRLKGYRSVILDRNEIPGGTLHYSIPDDRLDKALLEREILFIRDAGVEFRLNTEVKAHGFSSLVKEYDAVVIATGDITEEVSSWGPDHNDKQLLVDRNTFQTSLPNVFAAGNVTRSARLAIRSLGQGKEAAFSINQLLNGRPLTGESRPFNSRFGKLMQEEFAEYLKESTAEKRLLPEQEGASFTKDEVRKEAARCLHCDCRKLNDCRLRDYSGMYHASQKRFIYQERKPVKKYFQHDIVVYEPEKCIKCGICVRLTAKYQEKLGLTFIGRGFDVRIGVPFNELLEKSLVKTARLVAEACPTGALSLKEHKNN